MIKFAKRKQIKEKGNMMRNIIILCVAVILGAGYGCSEALALIKDLNTLQYEYELIAILDDNENLHNTLVDGVLVEGSLSQWDKYPNKE